LTKKEIKQVNPKKNFKTMSFVNIFANLCNFWKIMVLQGSTASFKVWWDKYWSLCSKFCTESRSKRIV